MSFPKPPSSLDNACAVVHGNTLYVYTPEAFMSLSLEEGSKWNKLDIGEKVTGGVCVGTDAGLFVVGGTGGSPEYSGLQKYAYSDSKWTSFSGTDSVTRNLQNHGATYMKSNDQILVYAGTRDGSLSYTSDAYIIPASNPINALAQGPSTPALKPILLSWSDGDACMVASNNGNTEITWYNPTAGWRPSGTTLADPITDAMRPVLMRGDDGTISLYVFDLSQSPNQVRRYVVQNASGQAVGTAEAVANDKRDLTMDNWPDYNSTFAPTDPRTNYAVAQDTNGNAWFVGGNEKKPLISFSMEENVWPDLSDSQKVLSDSTSSRTSSTKTSTSTRSSSTASSTETTSTTSEESSTSESETATESSEATWTASESSTATATDLAPIGSGIGDDDSGLGSSAILGITLGTILGFLAVLILILLLLRRRKKARQNSPETAQSRQDFPPDEKDPVAFGGNNPLSPSSGHFRGHNSQMSQDSYSSMAILMGRAGKNKSSLTRKPSHDTTRSSVSSVHKQLKATIGKPILQEMQHPVLQGQTAKGVAFDPTVAEPRPRNGPLETQDGLRRSSGWNRYWSGGSALQILGFGASKRNTVGSDSESHYSESVANRNPRATQDSATVPPLNFDFRPEMNRVNSGSPVVSEYSKIPFRDGVAGKIERPASKASSGYSSGIPESVNETWDREYQTKPWGTDRATSSVYNPSLSFGAPLSPNLPPPR
ncbi:hypothetical protein FZEAL_9685, partial [Fusarium zealandicum]